MLLFSVLYPLAARPKPLFGTPIHWIAAAPHTAPALLLTVLNANLQALVLRCLEHTRAIIITLIFTPAL